MAIYENGLAMLESAALNYVWLVNSNFRNILSSSSIDSILGEDMDVRDYGVSVIHVLGHTPKDTDLIFRLARMGVKLVDRSVTSSRRVIYSENGILKVGEE